MLRLTSWWFPPPGLSTVSAQLIPLPHSAHWRKPIWKAAHVSKGLTLLPTLPQELRKWAAPEETTGAQGDPASGHWDPGGGRSRWGAGGARLVGPREEAGAVRECRGGPGPEWELKQGRRRELGPRSLRPGCTCKVSVRLLHSRAPGGHR